MVSRARQVAFDVLRKVHAGGYASDLLLKCSDKLDSRDAGLASEIVFGCLRYQAQLDHFRLSTLRLSSSIVEHSTVRRGVVGSSPTQGATENLSGPDTRLTSCFVLLR
jgi:hypothetical protein